MEDFDIINRSNNPLESDNKHMNKVFENRPSMNKFTVITEKESQRIDEKVNDILAGKELSPNHCAIDMPVIPLMYIRFNPDLYDDKTFKLKILSPVEVSTKRKRKKKVIVSV